MAAGFDLSIVDIGLIRDVVISDRAVTVLLTFTEPGCPFTHHVMLAAEQALQQAGFAAVTLQPVWDRLWSETDLNATARQQFLAARRCMLSGGGRAVATAAP